MTNKQDRFKPTGLNSKFSGDNLPFSDYMEKMRNIVIQSRVDLDSKKVDWIIKANSPQEYKPEVKTGPKYKKGILLLHGLTASPNVFSGISKFLAKQGFLVRVVLLPGHGTRPADLLDVKYQEWVKCVEYGVASIKKDAEQVYIGGLSLGGALSLHHVIKDIDIKGVLLFAPAIKIKSNFTFMTNWHKAISWLIPDAKWLSKLGDLSHTKYESLPFSGAHETKLLIKKMHQLYQHMTLDVPIYLTISEDDETVCCQAAVEFFKKYANKDSRLRLYTKNVREFSDSRIQAVNSVYPEHKIIDYSHQCLTVAADDPHSGVNAEYIDFMHYHWRKVDTTDFKPEELYQGATTKENMANYRLKRLMYNPDFDNMLQDIEAFLKQT